MNTLEIKKKIQKLETLREKEKKYKKEADTIQEEIEAELTEYFDKCPVEDTFTDDNIHFEKEVKISRSINSQKTLNEHADIIVSAIKVGALSVTLNLTKTIKALKDHNIDPEQYVNLTPNQKLTYTVSSSDPEEPF